MVISHPHVEAILIDRICSLEWQLRQLDERITPELPLDDLRTLLQTAGTLETRLRMDLQALGMEPRAPAEPDWRDIVYGRQQPETTDAA